MDTKIKVNKEKNTVTLTIKVLMKPGDERIKNIFAKRILEKEGYEVGKCFEGKLLKNRDPVKEVLREGSWTFELLDLPNVPKPEPKKKETKKTYVHLRTEEPSVESAQEE